MQVADILLVTKNHDGLKINATYAVQNHEEPKVGQQTMGSACEQVKYATEVTAEEVLRW